MQHFTILNYQLQTAKSMAVDIIRAVYDIQCYFRFRVCWRHCKLPRWRLCERCRLSVNYSASLWAGLLQK